MAPGRAGPVGHLVGIVIVSSDPWDTWSVLSLFLLDRGTLGGYYHYS